MKNSLIIFLLFLLISCSNQVNNPVISQKLSIDSFTEYGEIHNLFLSNAKANFNTSNKSLSHDEKLEYLNNFNQEFVKKKGFTNGICEGLGDQLEKDKLLMDKQLLATRVFPNSNSLSKTSIADYSISQVIEEAYSHKLIDNFEYHSLVNLVDMLEGNLNGIVSDSEIEDYTNTLINQWNSVGYDNNTGKGKIMALTLAITKASLEWWKENPDAGTSGLSKSKALPAWLGADAVGALWGAGTGALGSYLGTGDVNWTAVGVGALSGAVSGSTGVVGKIADWLF